MSGWLERVTQLTKAGRDYITITLVGLRGSAPQVVGSKMLVTAEGLEWGTVGGGKIEAHCIQYGLKMLNEKSASELNTWNLQKDIGMSCGGEVSLFFEGQYQSHWTIALFGAGHISQEMCRVMQSWNCQVKVFDTRKEWINKLPEASNIERKLSESLADEVANLPQGTYLVSMTQGHATDLPVLEKALMSQERFAFLGVIGSKVKGQKIRKELREKGVSDLAIERLVCPVGLPIGNNTPPEITISIAAQLIAVHGEEND